MGDRSEKRQVSGARSESKTVRAADAPSADEKGKPVAASLSEVKTFVEDWKWLIGSAVVATTFVITQWNSKANVTDLKDIEGELRK